MPEGQLQAGKCPPSRPVADPTWGLVRRAGQTAFSRSGSNVRISSDIILRPCLPALVPGCGRQWSEGRRVLRHTSAPVGPGIWNPGRRKPQKSPTPESMNHSGVSHNRRRTASGTSTGVGFESKALLPAPAPAPHQSTASHQSTATLATAFRTSPTPASGAWASCGYSTQQCPAGSSNQPLGWSA